jgi:hypothetical protein
MFSSTSFKGVLHLAFNKGYISFFPNDVSAIVFNLDNPIIDSASDYPILPIYFPISDLYSAKLSFIICGLLYFISFKNYNFIKSAPFYSYFTLLIALSK